MRYFKAPTKYKCCESGQQGTVKNRSDQIYVVTFFERSGGLAQKRKAVEEISLEN